MEKKLILIIEDDLLVAKDIKEIVEAEGFNAVANITNYKMAIESIQNLNPNLVFVDINLSGTNQEGIRIAKFLHHLDKTPFIIVTSSYDKLTLEKIKPTRPYGFILKPFRDIDIIVNSILAINNFNHRKIDPQRIENEVPNETPFRIRNVIDYINQNIYNKIDIEDLAKITKWKKHHFIRVFSSIIGKTPYKYILERKMEIAKSLIESTNQPIQEISFDLSFQNYSNFYLAYKKIFNVSPEVTRKKNKVANFKFDDNSRFNSFD